MQIETKQGSATDPKPQGDIGVIIVNLCNTKGKWGGSGFLTAIDKLSPIPRQCYRQLAQDHGGDHRQRVDADIPLETVRLVQIQNQVYVANIVAQEATLDNASLRECLLVVTMLAVGLKCNIHMPAGMGSGRAGGDPTLVQGIVNDLPKTTAVELIEQRMAFSPRLVWWEYDQAPPIASTPTSTDPVVVATQAAADTCRGLDLSDDDDDDLLL